MQKTTFKKPFQMIIFGASGDLASLMLFPSIYELFIQNRLDKFEIIGFSRSYFSEKEFRKLVEDSVKKKFPDEIVQIKKFAEHFHYFQGDYGSVESFKELATFSQKLDKEKLKSKSEKLAYFSVPPQVYKSLLVNLSKTLKEAKLIIEKPFGSDGKTAKKLFSTLKANFSEEKVFLLDHYLGKRAYQSIYKLRFQNSVINNLISGKQIANIQISALEKADAAKRVGYFDQVGIIKDMIQSHLLQVLALITMEMEVNPSLESISKAKNNILKALRFNKSPDNLALGQYKSYKKTDKQVAQSNTETFAAIKLQLKKKEWLNIPIYIRTGKNVQANNQKVVIEFKKMPYQSDKIEANKLIFEIKPEEKLTLKLVEEENNNAMEWSSVEQVELHQNMACSGDHCLSEHASLILDVMKDRRTYFLTFAEVLSAWKLIDQVSAFIKNRKLKPEIYADEGDGPKQANALIGKDKFKWT
ncbi:MAG: hypothetical protein ACRCZE_04695 [Candidatus Altimarinota bacterium]